MMLDQITMEAGGHKRRKRVGRGEASGLGKTCTRGNKGCQSRAGGGTRPLHEGGQMPLFRRLPKRGFRTSTFARNTRL
jgi:large subunit ribosomal protein L15